MAAMQTFGIACGGHHSVGLEAFKMIDMRGGHAAEQHTHAHRRIRIPEHIAHIGEHPPGFAIDHHEFHGAARALALPSRRSSRARPCIILLSPSPHPLARSKRASGVVHVNNPYLPDAGEHWHDTPSVCRLASSKAHRCAWA